MIDLLPCPWCHGTRGSPLIGELQEDYGGCFRVSCYGCGIHTTVRRTPEGAATIWNNRVTPKVVAWQFKDSEWVEWSSITKEAYDAYRSGRHTGSGNSFEIRPLYADFPRHPQPMVPDGSMSVEAAIDSVIDLFPGVDRQALNVLARALAPKRSPVSTVCETCDGTGLVQISYTVARCCGRQMENGDCCGNPQPELDVQTENCPDCETLP